MDWSISGVQGGIPTNTNICQTFSPGATAAQIDAALVSSACANKVVLLNAGTYSIGALTFGHTSNVILRGSGANSTFLNFTGAGVSCGGPTALICMNSSDSTYYGSNSPKNWTAGYGQGTTQITLSNVTGITTSSLLFINQCDDGYSGTPCALPNFQTTHVYNVNDVITPQTNNSAGDNFIVTIGGTSGGANPNPWNQTVGGTQTSGSVTFKNTGHSGNVDNGNYFNSGDQCVQVGTACQTGTSQSGPDSGNGTTLRFQTEAHTIVSIVGNVVTLGEPLIHPNWASGQSPQAWAVSPLVNSGIENLSINGASATSGAGLLFFNVKNVWIKNIRLLNTPASGISISDASHFNVQDSYIFEGQGLDDFGISTTVVSYGLIQNNIIEQRAGSIIEEGSDAGTVIAYNFSIDNCNYAYHVCSDALGNAYRPHSNGTDFDLLEGNVGTNYYADGSHGSHLSWSAFRNFFTGWESCGISNSISPNGPCGITSAKDFDTNASLFSAYQGRYHQFVGNVLGTPGYHNVSGAYQYTSGINNKAIYNVGAGYGGSGTVQDAQVANTLMRWGNYDIFNNANRFLSSEVPSGISVYPNNIPPTQALPSSFYLTFKPSWFGTHVWPSIGPDITGGNVGQCAGTLNTSGKYNGVAASNSSQCAGSSLTSPSWGGHINLIPAMDCFLNVMNGAPDGTGTALSFDASLCYVAVTPPVVSLSRTSIVFPGRNVGTTSSLALVTLTNTGGSTLNISSITITGTNAGDFALGTTGSPCGSTVVAGGSCAIGVTFTPTALGARTASISIADNAADTPQLVALSGTGTSPSAPAVTLSATSLTFAGQIVNTTSGIQTVTLTNSGTANLTWTSLSITAGSSDYALPVGSSNTCTSPLVAAASCLIGVNFTPTTTGTRTGTVTLSDNASGAPHTISLTGTGIQGGLSFSPTSLSFGNQTIGTSAVLPITVTNIGTATISGIVISITGTNASQFSQANNCGTSLPASNTCVVNVTFTPTSAASFTANAHFVFTGGTGSPADVPLTGTGVATVNNTTYQGAGSIPTVWKGLASGPIPASYFGLHVNGGVANWPPSQGFTSFGTLRLWDNGSHSAGNPTEWSTSYVSGTGLSASYNFTNLDLWLALMKTQCALVSGQCLTIMNLGRTPQVFSPYPAETQCGYQTDGHGQCYVPYDITNVGGGTPPACWVNSSTCTTGCYNQETCNGDASGTNNNWKGWITALTNHWAGLSSGTYQLDNVVFEPWNETTSDLKVAGAGQWYNRNYTTQIAKLVTDASTIVNSAKGSLRWYVSTANTTTWNPNNVSGGHAVTQWQHNLLAVTSVPPAVSALSFHCYVSNVGLPQGPEETARIMIDQNFGMRSSSIVGSQAGSTYTMYNSECAWGTGANLTDPDQQKSYLARTYLLGWAAGSSSIAWYTWDLNNGEQLWQPTASGNCTDTADVTSGALCPAGIAYKAVYTWMVGNTQLGPCAGPLNTTTSNGGTPFPKPGVWQCAFQSPTGALSLAVWDASQTCNAGVCTTSTFTVPAPYNQYSVLESPSNFTFAPSGSHIQIGIKPILLSAQSGNSPILPQVWINSHESDAGETFRGIWSSSTTYGLGPLLHDPILGDIHRPDSVVLNGVEYVSLQNSNTNHTPPNATWWKVSTYDSVLFIGTSSSGCPGNASSTCNYFSTNWNSFDSIIADHCLNGNKLWHAIVTHDITITDPGPENLTACGQTKALVFESDTPNPPGILVCSGGIQDNVTGSTDVGVRNPGCTSTWASGAGSIHNMYHMTYTTGACTGSSCGFQAVALDSSGNGPSWYVFKDLDLYPSLVTPITGVSLTNNGTVTTMTFASDPGFGTNTFLKIVNATDSTFNISGAKSTRVDSLHSTIPQTGTGASATGTVSRPLSSIPVLINSTVFGSVASQANHIGFDRVYVHGDSTDAAIGNNTTPDFYTFNCGSCWIMNSYSDGGIWPGNESHAIIVSQATGPQKIVHNWLEGMSSGYFMGGANNVPLLQFTANQDVEQRRNVFTYPAAWLGKPASFCEGQSCVRKNCNEQKGVAREIADGNICQDTDLTGGQNGIGFTWAVRPCSASKNCDDYNSTLSDLTVTNNIVRGTCRGFGLDGASGLDAGISPGTYARRLLFRNNLVYNQGLSLAWCQNGTTGSTPTMGAAQFVFSAALTTRDGTGTSATIDLSTVPPIQPVQTGCSATGDGTHATWTCSSFSPVWVLGAPFTVSGCTPATGYNGAQIVTGATSTTVSAAENTTAAATGCKLTQTTYCQNGGGGVGCKQSMITTGDPLYVFNCIAPSGSEDTSFEVGPAPPFTNASASIPTALSVTYLNSGTANATARCSLAINIGYPLDTTYNHNTFATDFSSNGPTSVQSQSTSPYSKRVTITNNLFDGAGMNGDAGPPEGTQFEVGRYDVGSANIHHNVWSDRVTTLVRTNSATCSSTVLGNGCTVRLGDCVQGQGVIRRYCAVSVTSPSTTSATAISNFPTTKAACVTDGNVIWQLESGLLPTSGGVNPGIDYTEYGGANNNVQPPVTMFFGYTGYCYGSTADPSCMGYLGGLNQPTTGSFGTCTSGKPLPSPIANFSDWHNYALDSTSSYHNAASDGSDMGAHMSDIDAAQTSTQYVCQTACGTGPYPD
jgi:hypothetical protein